jgi:hypothetical protein
VTDGTKEYLSAGGNPTYRMTILLGDRQNIFKIIKNDLAPKVRLAAARAGHARAARVEANLLYFQQIRVVLCDTTMFNVCRDL